MLWRNSDGTVAMWLMNGTTPTTQVVIGTDRHHLADRRPRRFHGDGKADILWRKSDGTVAMWLMNGTTPTTQTSLGTIDTAWQIVGIGDFDGDGNAYILWRNSDGTLAMSLMNGITTTTQFAIGSVDTAWQIVCVSDFYFNFNLTFSLSISTSSILFSYELHHPSTHLILTSTPLHLSPYTYNNSLQASFAMSLLFPAPLARSAIPEAARTKHVSRLRSHIPGHAARVTIVRAGGLGDTILVLPALQLLRKRLPDAELTLVGSAWAERLRPLVGFPVRLVRFDSAALTPLFGADPASDPSGVFAGADLAIVYTSDPDDALVRNARRLCVGPVVAWPVDPPPGVHAAAHFAAAVAQDAEAPFPDLRVPGELRARARELLDGAVGGGVRPVAVHPGSGGRRKCWPPEDFSRLLQALGRPAVILRGPADDAACDALRTLSPVPQLTGLEVAEAGAVLAECALYVGNDSGPTHLAAGLGVPTVAVFGPTEPALWRPLGPRVRVVRGRPWPGVDEVLAVCREAAPPLG